MTTLGCPDLTAAGWDIHPDQDGCWTITTLTTDRTTIRLTRAQVFDLTCGTVRDTWPAFIHWTPDHTWAALRPNDTGPILWSNRHQMDLVRALLIDHVHTALIRAADAETRRTTRHRKRSATPDHHVNPTTYHRRTPQPPT
ncbi:hypothetical protein [Asanoa siamensis]|uniref:DUF317 domain-containing protein n=1 Tax=Asanoa siamensis TaxID=926357 RepID=A0ABQ4D548_9ACTN|nr:hypothetical protein [Asanoa siamensis]GIF78625.1 hypothetical protein Asi02nite_81430 [Asanoa siamensis]